MKANVTSAAVNNYTATLNEYSLQGRTLSTINVIMISEPTELRKLKRIEKKIQIDIYKILLSFDT